jgi:hypothetical protein
MATRSTQKEKHINKEYISCEENDIWPVTNGLQNMLEQPNIIVNWALL